jgi:hypothetical protein
MADQAIGELAPIVGKRAACAALGRSRATYYRRHRRSPASPRPGRRRSLPPWALSGLVEAGVLRQVEDSPGRVVRIADLAATSGLALELTLKCGKAAIRELQKISPMTNMR